MPVPQPTRAEHDEFLTVAETQIQAAVDAAARQFLERVSRTLRDGLNIGWDRGALVAATADLPVSLATLQGWWRDLVEQHVIAAVTRVWQQVYQRTHPGPSTLDPVPAVAAAVTDRLVEGLVPPLPDDAMNRVRTALTLAVATGWSTARLARQIAVVLDWAPRNVALEQVYDDLTADIAAILDPLGAPGTPAREIARTTDPNVAELQAQRSRIRLTLDEEQTYWQMRATRIARTEATTVYNAANFAALVDEGWAFKEWIATRDNRTRETHVLANGQIRPIGVPFLVGVTAMQTPGDPTAPPEEIVNCRCIVTGVESPPGS